MQRDIIRPHVIPQIVKALFKKHNIVNPMQCCAERSRILFCIWEINTNRISNSDGEQNVDRKQTADGKQTAFMRIPGLFP